MRARKAAVCDDAVSIGRDPLKRMCNWLSAFKEALVILETPDRPVEGVCRRERT
jgi:hypothetical protein